MTLIKNNPLLKGASGMLGKTIVYRTSRGQQQMVNRSKKRKRTSVKQKAVIAKFEDAIRYARRQMKNPDAVKEYRKGVNDKLVSPYNVALTDYLRMPVIDYIKAPGYTGAVGNIITISADNGFKVVSVEVEIISGKKILEKGTSTPTHFRTWIFKYVTTVLNKNAKGTVIRAKATDKPGNETVVEIVL